MFKPDPNQKGKTIDYTGREFNPEFWSNSRPWRCKTTLPSGNQCHSYSNDQKRLYIRQKAVSSTGRNTSKFVGIGWFCTVCHHVTLTIPEVKLEGEKKNEQKPSQE